MKKSTCGFVGLVLAVAIAPCLTPITAGAVGVVKKEIAGEKFSLNIFGFSQLTLESGDGVASGQDATDDGLRVGADRVRIGYKIWWGKVFSKLHLDFNRPDIAKSKAGLPEIIKDAQVGYKFSKAAFFNIGMFKTPVGMDFNIPGKYLDVTKRGMEKKLVLERSVGAMLSGRDVMGSGLGYDIGYFQPTIRSGAVTGGAVGEDNAYAARIHYDYGKMVHAEISYGISENAGGADTNDYKVWDAAVALHPMKQLTLKGEYIDGSDVKGEADRDQQVWYLHAGYQVTPMVEPVVRYYYGNEDLHDTNLSNLFLGLNVNLLPEKKHSARVQVNYVVAGGDGWDWKGVGGYKDDAFLAQFQVSF